MSTTAARVCPIIAQPRPPMQPVRVVLVDDEPGILDTWGIILGSQGYEVQCFPEPVSALEAITRGCDIVLTDYHMPKMTGLDLIRTAQPWSKAKFVLMTANTSEAVAEEALAAGASCVVHKPTSAPWVLQKLAGLAARK